MSERRRFYYILSSYENLLRMDHSGDEAVRGIKDDHRGRMDWSPRENLPFSAACLYLTGVMDYTTGITLKEWLESCGIIVAIHMRREPAEATKWTHGRPQGSMCVQYKEARMATAAIEKLHGLELPSGEGGERMRPYTLSVQRADREFDLSRMTGRVEFQNAATRVPASGHQNITWPISNFWIYAAYLSSGYDADGCRGHPTDIIRQIFPNDMTCPKTGETMPEWLRRAGEIWGAVSKFN